MTPHINASKEDIAEIVLMPGDPYRAKWAAENFLTKPRLINQVRGMLGFTGQYKDTEITIHGSGMGMPSLSIYVNELIQESYPKAITENEIRPASSPKVTIDSEDPKKPLTYSAIIEIFPEIKPKFSRWTSFEEFTIDIENTDIDKAIEDILKRYGDWKDVKREAQLDDQVVIDFLGKINGE